MNEFIFVYQQLIAMYDSGCQICCYTLRVTGANFSVFNLTQTAFEPRPSTLGANSLPTKTPRRPYILLRSEAVSYINSSIFIMLRIIIPQVS